MRSDGARIAYHCSEGAAPGVVFLGGLRSDMTGTKATAPEAACTAAGRAFVRFDYFGHGRSTGAFTDGTIGRWRDDALAVLDELTVGRQVLVGSSMGGWIMLLAALARPQRIHALVGVAAAPDFTEDLMWDRYDDATRRVLATDGVYREASPYDDEPTPVTMQLIDDGRKNLLLRGPIPITCPVRLLHGKADAEVPWATSIRLAEALQSPDVTISLAKGGDHRLSEPGDLARLMAAVEEVCGAHHLTSR